MQINYRPTALLFDYGNVLEGPLDPDKFNADLSELAHQHGFDAGEALWHHLYICEAWERAKRGQISRDAYWEERLAALGIKGETERKTFKQRLHRHRGLLPEMDALLRDLKDRGYRLAVISNTSRPDLGQYLAEFRGLRGLFEVVVSSADVGIAKPDPQIYQIALGLLGVQPSETLFIDDLKRNTDAAEVLGIPSVIFTTPDALRAVLRERGIL